MGLLEYQAMPSLRDVVAHDGRLCTIIWYCRKGGVFHSVVEEDFLPSFLSAIFKPARRNPVSHPDPERLVSESGTKATPLLGSEN
jgi:hypothetical protein